MVIYIYFEEGIYEVTLTATDSNGIEGTQVQEIDVTDIISIEPSVYNTYMPYQGAHITGSLDTYDNNKSWFDIDRDKRPTLGTFYYKDDNLEGWESIGPRYSGADQGTPGNSPDFTYQKEVENYEQAIELGLISNIQLLYNTDKIDLDITMWNAAVQQNHNVWKPEPLNSINGIKVDGIK